MKIESAAPQDDPHYLAALQSCFGGWGGEREFAWYFRRPFDGRVADRFVISEDGEWIAGSAVTWRRLTDGGGTVRPVGVMTGSWTLPAARGRGCFKAIIDRSRQLAVQRGADWLLAFVTEDNASRRLLERAGSLMIPAYYLWSEEGTASTGVGAAAELVEPSAENVDRLWRLYAQQTAGTLRFSYPDADAWADQFVKRPLPVEILHFEKAGTAIVERHPIFDRILATVPLSADRNLDLAGAVHARALQAGRRFFAFTTCRAEAEALKTEYALGGTPGFITLLPAASEPPAAGLVWAVESGDRV